MINEFTKRGAPIELAELMMELLDSVRQISETIISTNEGKAGTKNIFGEEQAAMDLASEEIMQAHLKSCPFVAAFGSEELDEMLPGGAVLHGADQGVLAGAGNEDPKLYSVFYDPLDGSSLINVNFSIGTIIGVFEGAEVMGRTAREQVAALFAVYGPRTSVMLTVGGGVMELLLVNGEWIVANGDVKLKGDKKYFAPGNLRATKEREDYFDLVTWYMKEQYTLRYSGGMVPDVNHILKKGSGIFMYPGSVSKPAGKLRLLYECGPMAMIMEQAGGAASDGTRAILDLEIESLVQTTPIFIGQTEEVERAEKML
jgi:fructose-1,6-bisphosphatase I